MGKVVNSPLFSCYVRNQLNVQYGPNPTFLRRHLHGLFDSVKSRVEGLLVRQVNQAEIAVSRVATEARTVDHEYAGRLQQIEGKLFVRAAVQIVSLDH